MNDKTKKCPFCGEEIKVEAIKCRYCRESLNTNPLKDFESKNKQENSDLPNSSRNAVKSSNVLLIIGIFIIVGVIGVIVYSNIQQNNLKEANKLQSLNICLANAESNYHENWKTSCVKNAKRIKDGYNNCTSDASFCRSLWGTPDSSENCLLPKDWANNVEQWRTDDKNDCYYKYPIK